MKTCPTCNSELVSGKLRRFETLVEHVSDPNKYYFEEAPLRETIVCPKKCYGSGAYWDANYGDSFVETPEWYHWAWKLTNYRWPRFPVAAPDLD